MNSENSESSQALDFKFRLYLNGIVKELQSAIHEIEGVQFVKGTVISKYNQISDTLRLCADAVYDAARLQIARDSKRESEENV